MAILVDAYECSSARFSREIREPEDDKKHHGSAIIEDKYLPLLFGSPRDGNYSSLKLFQSYLLGYLEKLLIQQHADIDGNGSVEVEHENNKSTAASKDCLLINTTERNNKYSKTINVVETNHQCIEKEQNIPRLSGPKQQSIQSIHLLIATLICLHNASSCASFSMPDDGHNIGLSRNDNYRRNHLTTDNSISSLWQWPNRIKRGLNEYSRRSFYDTIDQMNPLADLSSIFGSFSQDGSSNGPPGGNGAQQSWTSIFGGGDNSNGGNSNNVGGGDALDVHIKNILVPRVSGTPGNVQVRQYIVDVMHKNNYQVELDEFTSNTPIGNVRFANIIASSNSGACRQLVLACHYDSKLQEGFLGATDSAVPCAMLLKIAETHNKIYRDESVDLGLKFIFFDGEEAFVQWTAIDSLYGSRHLAAKWAKQQAPVQCQGKAKNELERIELFVLLDLIGASDTSFVMYNTQLRAHYESLQKHERTYLVKSGLSQAQARRQAAFRGRTMPFDFVEDDHVPFKKRGVPIMLLLAHPFPRVWHTNADNYESIDWAKTRRILHVMQEFVSNYPSNRTT